MPGKYEGLQQYMAPGTTLDDLSSSSDDDGEQQTRRVRNAQGPTTSLAKFQPTQHKHVDASVLSRIHVEDYHDSEGYGGGGGKANQRVLNELRDATMGTTRYQDRSERATVEGVLDPRTRLILYKLVNSNILQEINGCVSAGKEANVYYGVAGDGSPVALKVYKTSILVFKDREQYVSGEFRFQRYCKSNPRKMVRTWAEKEARNLGRLQEGGVLAPAVRLLRQHVLVMEFLGEDGWPAPRLKEVKFPSLTALDNCYLDLCCTMRKIYARCRLIHGDLSEYNLLLFRGRVVVIDVSQSVEKDHPRAMDFLRRDIVNVNAFFRSKGHPRLFSLQTLFHFITAPAAAKGWQRSSGPDNSDELLEHLRALQEEITTQEPASEEKAKVDEQVFLNMTVPRSLAEIGERTQLNPEIAPFVHDMMADSHSDDDDDDDDDSDDDDDNNNHNKKNKSHSAGDGRGDREAAAPGAANDTDDDDDDDEEEEEDGAAAGAETEDGNRKKRAYIAPEPTLASMSRDERKEHKKAVKEANRLKRIDKKKNKGKKK